MNYYGRKNENGELEIALAIDIEQEKMIVVKDNMDMHHYKIYEEGLMVNIYEVEPITFSQFNKLHQKCSENWKPFYESLNAPV